MFSSAETELNISLPPEAGTGVVTSAKHRCHSFANRLLLTGSGTGTGRWDVGSRYLVPGTVLPGNGYASKLPIPTTLIQVPVQFRNTRTSHSVNVRMLYLVRIMSSMTFVRGL